MKIAKFFAIAVVAAATLSVNACAQKGQKAAVDAAANMEQPSDIKVPASDTQFRPGMKVDKPTLVDFNAVWCGPCQMLTPAFDLAAAEYAGKVDFYSINVDSFPQTAQAYAVQGIPYLVLIMPDGTMQEHVGLNDFIEGLDPESNPTQDEITNTLFSNMKKMIDSAIK